eukprot:TRINITY_DN33742_c2_g1_i1.p1 TRINITY_DN33742_c2_g1~~TRINITY_DN33742_c2_g1_i1.p1  ORF type:complete len:691 (-),score=126.72 TRINITY_DN33742_c2_g1_i1:102-2174(-)
MNSLESSEAAVQDAGPGAASDISVGEAQADDFALSPRYGRPHVQSWPMSAWDYRQGQARSFHPQLGEDFYAEFDEVRRGITLTDSFLDESACFAGPCTNRADFEIHKEVNDFSSFPHEYEEVSALELHAGKLATLEELEHTKAMLQDAELNAERVRHEAEDAWATASRLQLRSEEAAETAACLRAEIEELKSWKAQAEREQESILEAFSYWQSKAEELEARERSNFNSMESNTNLEFANPARPLQFRDPFVASMPLETSATKSATRLRYLYASPLLHRDRGHTLVLPQLQHMKEIAAVEGTVAARMTLEVEVATEASLRRALNESDVWLHFSMHGIKDARGEHSQLLFEDPCSASAKPVCSKILKDILHTSGPAKNPFVFISACESESLARIWHTAGVKNVIYCDTKVRDVDAYRFAHYLYHALVNKRTLKASFEIACGTARSLGDHAHYCLLSEETGDKDLQVALSSCTMQGATLLSRSLALPRRVEDFRGRHGVMDATVRLLSQRSVVVLHAERPGLGLSATLIELAHFLASPGRMFADCCSFYPHQIPGGLLICDDFESPTTRADCEKHLEVQGSKVLAGCRGIVPPGLILNGHLKVITIKLEPLSDGELAALYLSRVQRPLLLQDLLPKGSYEEAEAERVLLKDEAVQLAKKCMARFCGRPGDVCQAASRVLPGTAALHGNLDALL